MPPHAGILRRLHTITREGRMSANQRPTNWRKVLGPAQTAMLLRLAVAEELCPGGQGEDTGRLASAWNRTLDALVARRLAESPPREYPQARVARISEFGRMLLRGSYTISYKRS